MILERKWMHAEHAPTFPVVDGSDPFDLVATSLFGLGMQKLIKAVVLWAEELEEDRKTRRRRERGEHEPKRSKEPVENEQKAVYSRWKVIYSLRPFHYPVQGDVTLTC